MRILISEDSDSKFNRIQELLNDEFTNLAITRIKSGKATVIELMNNEYEFLIQDMQMPLHSDSRNIDILCGVYVLSQLRLRSINIKTVVCSSDDQRANLDANNLSEIPCVVYNSTTWKRDLIKTIKDL